MAYDKHSLGADSNRDLAQNEYYKSIQEQLREKFNKDQDAKQEKASETHEYQDHESDKKVEGAKASVKSSQIDKLLRSTDKVQIKNFSWEKDEHGEFVLTKKPEPTVVSSVDLKNDGNRILRLFGHRIDLNDKVATLKESLMQATVQSRSHNFFLSKYAQFKAGMFVQLLSAMGITPEEIQKLQKEALKGAQDENIRLMGENIYNMELAELVHGRNRQVKHSLKLFKEIEMQLIQQMEMFGKKGFWNKISLLEQRMIQCQKIEDEFIAELKALTYQYDYMTQDLAADKGLLHHAQNE